MAAAETEDRTNRRYFAPNGGALHYPNFNADSQHPNPWRPKTVYEKSMLVNFGALRLTEKTQPVLKPRTMDIETEGVFSNITYYGRWGLKFGLAHGVMDAVNISRLTEFNQGLARTLYIAVPWVGMFTSYPAAFHLLNNLTVEKNTKSHYFLSAAAPGAVWGIFKRCPWSGSRVWFFWGSFMATAKFLNDEGFGFGPNSYALFDRRMWYQQAMMTNDPEKEWAKTQGLSPNWWQKGDVKLYPMRGFDEGGVNDKKWDVDPGWYKHVSEEERKKGPAKGF